MLLNWEVVESTERPLEVDNMLSPSGAYLRKDIQEIDGKFQYKEVFLGQEYKGKSVFELLEIFKAEMQNENAMALAGKKTIVTSLGEFSIKTPTYDFIFCLMALKDIPTGIPAGMIRFYGGEAAPAMTQTQVQALYLEYAGKVAELDGKFIAYKAAINNAETIQELEDIQIVY